MLINQTEAEQIARFISSCFNKVSKQYDFSKYPKWAYDKFKLRFSQLKPTNQDIHDALVWKYGHWGKPNFPAAHCKLISEVQALWPQFVKTNNCFSSVHTFQWWQSKWPKTRYITVAFITHLIHHKSNIPIIDQHNFRAMNDLISRVRNHYSYKEKPSSWQDIMNLKEFMETLLPYLANTDLSKLDRFLMMWGKHVKKQCKHTYKKNP